MGRIWRPWTTEGEDLVELPRALAVDLVRALTIAPFVVDATEEDLDAGRHEDCYLAHQERIQEALTIVANHLGAEGIRPTPEAILRALAITYEAAPAVLGRE